MLDSINDNDKNEKEEQILKNDQNLIGTAKKKIILLISLTIGAVLLIIIALVIFLSLDKSDKSDESSENDSTDIDITNIIRLKYKPKNVGEIQLFNSKYINLLLQ